jgi:AcrR family transcriptional regulator
VHAFAEGGFDGTSTRDIARRASVTQGLITYHFASKDELWRRAVDAVFAGLDAAMPEGLGGPGTGDGLPDARDARRILHVFVSFSARHPELFRIMVDAGRHDDERMRWIVDRHLRGRFEAFGHLAGIEDAADLAHVYYAVVGASSLISAVAPECRTLTGVDPLADESIRRHADLVADLLLG